MLPTRFSATASALCALSLAAAPLAAQANLAVAPSGRATATVTLSTPRVQGQPAPTPRKITIDYGQPHARGRAVAGALAGDLGKVWRLGANEATTLTSDIDLVIGGAEVPKGSYTLFTETSPAGWSLIISKKIGQWGTEYEQAMDLARVPLRQRTLSSPVESFTIWLVPAASGARGELRFAWGTLEHAVDWSAK